jgi:hypothetical protein
VNLAVGGLGRSIRGGRFIRGARWIHSGQPRHTGVEVDVEARTVLLTSAVLAALIGQLLTREQFTHNAHAVTVPPGVVHRPADGAS